MKATQLYRKHILTRIKRRLNSFANKRDGALNAFVKSFLTRIKRSVLLKIFCAKMTRRTRFLERSAVNGSGLSEQHRISSV